MDAVRLAAKVLKTGVIPDDLDPDWNIGHRVSRVDVEEKVLGIGKYPDDFYIARAAAIVIAQCIFNLIICGLFVHVQKSLCTHYHTRNTESTLNSTCFSISVGMVMCTKALLDVNKEPTDDEIKYALRNNYCRCTGYEKLWMQ